MTPKVKARLKQALDRINAAYVQGCVDYYQSLPPDPWTSAHERLDQVLLGTEERLVLNHITLFESELLGLISDFKRTRIRIATYGGLVGVPNTEITQ